MQPICTFLSLPCDIQSNQVFVLHNRQQQQPFQRSGSYHPDSVTGRSSIPYASPPALHRSGATCALLRRPQRTPIPLSARQSRLSLSGPQQLSAVVRNPPFHDCCSCYSTARFLFRIFHDCLSPPVSIRCLIYLDGYAPVVLTYLGHGRLFASSSSYCSAMLPS